MPLTRRVALALLAGLPLARVLAAEPASTLGEIVGKHTTARGGAAALDAVKTLALDVEITEGGQTIAAHYIASIVPLVRIDIVVDGRRVYSEGVDSQGVWLWPGDEAAAKPSVAEGAANALLHGAESNLIGLHRFAERGHGLALMPPESIDGVAYQVIEVTYSTGHKTYYYLDPADWLIKRKRDERAYHPDIDQTKARVESRYSDFQSVDSVLTAHRNEDYDLDKKSLLSVNQITRRVINPVLSDGVFDRAWVAQ